jgi:hypothetical protein
LWWKTIFYWAHEVVREGGHEYMSAEENKAPIRRYYEEIDAAAKDERGASFLDEFVTSDYVNHTPLLALQLTWKV